MRRAGIVSKCIRLSTHHRLRVNVSHLGPMSWVTTAWISVSHGHMCMYGGELVVGPIYAVAQYQIPESLMNNRERT